MRSNAGALRAYQAAAGRRGLRDQEADVFRLVTGRLRAARDADAPARARALADAGRLWVTLMDLLRDPGNPLPAPLRASVLSVGHAVRREIDRPEPDLDFLIAINEGVADGLAGAARAG